MEELLKNIQSTYDFLPQAQRLVAEYIVHRYREIPFLSVTAIANEIGVSDTTIIKYCMQLGFDGFGGFKKLVSDCVQDEVRWYNKLEQHMHEIAGEDTLARVSALDIQNIQATTEGMQNRANFDRLVEALVSAKQIYIVGFRSSAVAAQYLSMLLVQQGYSAFPILPGLGDYYDTLCRMTPGDLLISISFSRYSSDVINMVKVAKQNGIDCVSITDSPLSPVAVHADYSLICSVKSYHNAPSLAGCFALISSLLTASAQRRRDTARAHQKRIEDLIEGAGGLYPGYPDDII